ncbi:MAG: serine/threonine protein kinase, partial [Bacteroidetes bacterium]|nr:serine/threonine protein kinase [Bacteroidota bacterium]
MFDKFEIIDCLKKDGQTGVYLANHIYLGKKILLKTLNTEGLSDKTILERFKREAKILAQLDHPNLIKVLDFGTYNNFFYISFEYFESKNLREVINNNNLSVEDKKYLIVQLLKALKVAHQNQIIHRDIKPENILVNSKLILKIADFGLALVVNENFLTNSSTIVGTPSYMAPEQIRGERSQQTDLFSAGLVSYELFTEENPVLGKDVGETINNILNFDLEKCYSKLEQMPVEVHSMIKSMLQNNLDKRVKSAAEALSLLGVEAEEFTPVTNSTSKKKLKNILIYSLPVIVLAIVIIVFWFQKSYNGKSFENQNIPLTVSQSANNSEQKNNVPLETQKISSSESATKNSKMNNQSEQTISKTENVKTVNSMLGSVSVDCYPWADVDIDSNKVGITPIWNYSLTTGVHVLKLINSKYPTSYIEKINIIPG